MKAFLTLEGIEAPRTHDLRRLIELAAPSLPALIGLEERADTLSSFGVQLRYPDGWREVPESLMRESIDLADEFASLLLPRLHSAL